MQTLLGPPKLESLLKSPSEPVAQDLEPASPFANVNAIASFWKGICYMNDGWRHAVILRLRLHAFADFELDSFRQKLDEQGMTVAENQESSLKSRRRLATTTRGLSPIAGFAQECHACG